MMTVIGQDRKEDPLLSFRRQNLACELVGLNRRLTKQGQYHDRTAFKHLTSPHEKDISGHIGPAGKEFATLATERTNGVGYLDNGIGTTADFYRLGPGGSDQRSCEFESRLRTIDNKG
ncbi:MAG: hypothetical protein KJ717_03795 [Proteobacteria bacterium]|nr:hypothetical protein [Pseudomonadota bacterium]